LQIRSLLNIVHLSKDKKLHKIILLQEPSLLSRRNKVHLHLCNSIMSQQLSTKVADVFQQRFLGLYNGKIPTPTQVVTTPFETLRGIGLSNAKANYIQHVCQFFIDEKLTDARLHKMSNEELVQYLTQIKGVGKWTVEMLLMFTFGREDVFAIDDLGIQQAMCLLYKINTADKKAMQEKMLRISTKWSPYRTYACRYLWSWKDNLPKP
jgi:DNA-3-methyladenine glycosylase II